MVDRDRLPLTRVSKRLAAAGADAVVLCTNTMHFVSQGIEVASGLPLLHIVDPTAEQILQAGFTSVGLLGTRFTMEKEFYRSRLAERFGLDVVMPDEKARTIVHDIIYTELCNGIITEDSRRAYLEIIAELKRKGADCLILGCTEIGLLVTAGMDVGLPVFDTTLIHAVAAADWAMKN